MHELPITQKIIHIAEEQCRAAGGGSVTEIRLVIGDNSGIVGSSVELYFDMISEGTLCQDARLSIKRIRPKLRCKSCGALFERRPLSFTCPDCGGEGEPTEIGREFYVESIEIETDEEDI